MVSLMGESSYFIDGLGEVLRGSENSAGVTRRQTSQNLSSNWRWLAQYISFAAYMLHKDEYYYPAQKESKKWMTTNDEAD